MIKLPEPSAHLADSLPLFTEAQMLQFRRDVLEEAAAVSRKYTHPIAGLIGHEIWLLEKETT